MIDNVVYVSTMYTRVVALDAETGEHLWAFDPEAWRTGPDGGPPGGFKHRGVAVWPATGNRTAGAGEDMRVFINSRDSPVCAERGRRVADPLVRRQRPGAAHPRTSRTR